MLVTIYIKRAGEQIRVVDISNNINFHFVSLVPVFDKILNTHSFELTRCAEELESLIYSNCTNRGKVNFQVVDMNGTHKEVISYG